MKHSILQHVGFLFALLSLVACTHLANAAGPTCEPESRITQAFDNGSVWDMCWESRIRENLVLSDIYYTPPNGKPFRVLSSARLSQLHVAYDDSNVTYNDVTQYGLGGGYLLTLTSADCPLGQLLEIQKRPALCVWRNTAETGYRTVNRAVKTESFNLFSVSQVGAYAYIMSWTFYADGSIEPSLGATGALQRSTNDTELSFGRVLQGDPNTLWLSHTHNYYWRLDFDLGESATDDQLMETRYVLADDGTREQQTTTFTTEQARRIDPASMTSWTLLDNNQPHSAGYKIEPIRSGHRFERRDVEPYTDFDIFVTVANDCERFASQNARFNPDCLNNVLEYVDGQSVENQDLVLWYRVAFHHVPRSEDQRHMHTHWDGFLIKPQNILSGTNSLIQKANTVPVLNSLVPLLNVVGDVIHEHIQADDADGDTLNYSGTGLPPGVSLDSQGHLNGQTNTVGIYVVTINTWDDFSQATQSFEWTVNGSTQRTRRIGALGLSLMAGLLLLLTLRLTGSRV